MSGALLSHSDRCWTGTEPLLVDWNSRNCYHDSSRSYCGVGLKMSARVSIHQLQDRLAELLDRVVKTGEEYVVQRNGKDCAVLVSAQQWRRRNAALRLDALGAGFRLSRPK